MRASTFITGIAALSICSCGNNSQEQKAEHAGDTAAANTAVQQVNLPAPFATESTTKFSNVIGWPQGRTPKAPEGFAVSKFADSLNNPRWIYTTPNGDILVAEANTEPKLKDKAKAVVSGKAKSQNLGNSANRITLFRDADGDGRYELRSVFLEGLNQPLGMLVLNNQFYVANTDGVMQFAYTPGQTNIKTAGKKILELPAGGYNNHWTRNLLAAKDGSKIYVAVGSGSNVGENGMEHEVRRAAILEINPDGSGEKIYGAGLRNPVGMDWAPGSNTLYTAVNERDGLGDDLVPDYLTSVRPGGFYGWPYAYFGPNEDPRMKDQQKPELVKQTIVPDVPLGAHTASLGLAFDQKGTLPGKYKGGAFIGQHGSWNRSQFSGYKVVFVPFAGGKPAGNPEDFLSGFVTGEEDKVYGRPVGIAFSQQGNMLVADDAANTIWLVKPQGK